MSIALENLYPQELYNVIRSVADRESVLATGGEISSYWREFALFGEDDEIPQQAGGYIRVRCSEEASVAVWRDLTHPELAMAELDPVTVSAVRGPARPRKSIPFVSILHQSLEHAAIAFRYALRSRVQN